jgi:ribosomal protein L7Ae-like RNA K-turn-binding protein
VEKNFILFPNYTQGLKLESLLKNKKIKYVISPTPRQLSKCCGISIMYEKRDEENIKSIIRDNSVEVLGLYSLD